MEGFRGTSTYTLHQTTFHWNILQCQRSVNKLIHNFFYLCSKACRLQLFLGGFVPETAGRKGWHGSQHFFHVPWYQLLLNPSGCTLGEDLYLRQKYFRNLFFNYQKIRTDILTIEKKFHNFLTTNKQQNLGAKMLAP